jgi:type I site-specific restriction endonuclease
MDKRPMPIRAKPFEHQKRAYLSALGAMESGSSRGYALLMEMGTGKTITSVAIAGRLFLDGNIRKVRRGD